MCFFLSFFVDLFPLKAFDGAAAFVRDVLARLAGDVSDATATDVASIVDIGGERLQLGRVAASKFRPNVTRVEHDLSESAVDAAIGDMLAGLTPRILCGEARARMDGLAVLYRRLHSTLLASTVVENNIVTKESFAGIVRRIDGSG